MFTIQQLVKTPYGPNLWSARMNDKAAFAERLAAAMRRAGLEPRASVLEKEFNTRYWGRAVTYQAVARWLKGSPPAPRRQAMPK